MTFSKEWEMQYSSNSHMSIWPWSDVVSYVMRYARPESADFQVLEIGCGAGANIPFFRKLGVNYIGVDGSSSIIDQLKKAHPDLVDNLFVMDFTKDLPDGMFDLVLDRASLTNDSTDNIRATIESIIQHLKPQGKFIGIDWFSTEYSDFQNPGLGQETTDRYTKKFGDESGSFCDLGNVHFSDEKHLRELFSDFELKHLQHKTIEKRGSESDWRFASWNFVAEIQC